MPSHHDIPNLDEPGDASEEIAPSLDELKVVAVEELPGDVDNHSDPPWPLVRSRAGEFHHEIRSLVRNPHIALSLRDDLNNPSHEPKYS